MRVKRDRQKKRFIAALADQGTVYHAAQAAGISCQTAYRWQRDDPEFAEACEEAHENAVDVVENTMYQQAVGGNTLAGIFYLKAHRPMYRDRLNIDIEQVNSEIRERMAQLRENPDLLRHRCSRLIAISDAKLSISQRRRLSPHSCERQLQWQRQN